MVGSKDTSDSTKRIGLVLGGGGMRGLAHIGVLKALEEAGIKIDMLAGTSMGGVIGSLYAAGLSVAEIETKVLELTTSASIRRLLDIHLNYRGFVRGERIYNLIADTIGPDITFADLDLPLKMVATDVVTGCEVILDQGKVVDAVRATISIPFVFKPVEQANMTLVDGGILNNVPTDVARKMGADIVIAVDVMPDFSLNTPGQTLIEQPIDPPSLPNFLQETFHVVYIMISAMTRLKLEAYPPDILLRPAIAPEIDLLLGYDRAEEVITAGEQAALQAMDAIQGLLS
ncbi:MAG: patatin-like phospholipase family protein [Candidatus Promineifilaceae bacterium]|jgi:NTE family protein